MNGNPSRKKLPEVTLQGSDLPAGSPPRGMPKDQQVVWKALVLHFPWLNATHRLYMEIVCRAAVHLLEIDECFIETKKQLKREGSLPGFAFQSHTGNKHHPLWPVWKDARDSYNASVRELGGSVTAQASLLGYIDDALRRKAKQKKEKESYLT